ncbi:hypothetical protein J2Y55_005167 [Bosea sp. BE125]|uniref:hypothetical protein n=1 Tax=Bosea sp. BE125 TaxID=2817909 RepID=UPI0028573C11|nr:hypothetical protein [Bosea sp. BE125]MDR6874134.1 hypothetical protein [Bosea sp. BE125]
MRVGWNAPKAFRPDLERRFGTQPAGIECEEIERDKGIDRDKGLDELCGSNRRSLKHPRNARAGALAPPSRNRCSAEGRQRLENGQLSGFFVRFWGQD